MRVTIWNEFRHEKENDTVKSIYPRGIHGAIAEFLEQAGYAVQTRTLDDPEQGLDQETLQQTDVLIWWAHKAHAEVHDHAVERVKQRVLAGMGLIVLHSGHFSKIFRNLMGTTCDLKWREDGEKERIWVVQPSHPITRGLEEYFELPQEEMYGEHFDIPEPDHTLFISWFEGGEVFRSGCTYNRGKGKIFYFRPGHETYPTYYDKNVQTVICNAVEWAAAPSAVVPNYGNTEALEPILRLAKK
ncbi:ThuA domain-containing protein [Terribacillus sp. DMT04]|uniref:ThuA domain-containing protein n=1 Tax=Terribacillus sp. DMT04 TaxID=2850441 RepID=UPI001C2BFCEC|nr:ThuA domain-containing protein [Terribacillus sp. DMT04]QXE01006.1 ThuA domain-containing protein [Terribacillus sp. DMT04]